MGTSRRVLIGSSLDGLAMDGLDAPAQLRPGTAADIRFSGFGLADGVEFVLVPEHALSSILAPEPQAVLDWPCSDGCPRDAAVQGMTTVGAATETGPHALIGLAEPGWAAVCHWLARPTNGCVLAEVAVSGASLPAGAANFGDRLALLDVAIDTAGLVPGGQLPVTLTWQGLAPMSEDYTVFVQVLDAADRLVGQVDAWPVQGTFPTSQWTPGERVRDPYRVQLEAELPPGDYRLHVGLYLLATMERLPVLDAGGVAVDDKIEVLIR